MYDFLSIGDTQLDTVMVLNPDEVEVVCKLNQEDCKMCFDYASKIPVAEMHTMVAGNAANAAVTSARLDGATAFWTMLGDDDIADFQIQYLKVEGVDTTFVRKTPGTKSNRSTVISVKGERTILVYHDPRNYQLPNDLPASRWLYLSSMAQGSEKIFEELAVYLEKNQANLVYQPGTFQLRLGPKAAAAILSKTAMIIMNKEEAQLYTDLKEAEIPDLLPAITRLGPKTVVITDGRKGSFAYDGKDKWYLGIRPEIPRIEATGAGDAYASAFAVALMKGQTVPEAMRWGTFNAESVIQKFGPQAGILRGAELNAELEQYSDFKAVKI